MPAQDTSELKKRIIVFLTVRGPSLPVHIAKAIDLSPLFTSAFLSELLSEKRLIISNMKVGSSPLYLIPGQEEKLEKFSNYLNSKEKEAFEILKNKKFLKDSEQEPAIRVALRQIRDFAVPFKRDAEIFWRYFIVPENDFKEPVIKSEIQEIIPEKDKELNIFEGKTKEKREKQKSRRAPVTRKSTKTNEKFFNKIKDYLSSKNIEIIDIITFNKNDLTLKINDGEEILLMAYNKKRINEEDIIKAHKKATEYGLKYKILCLGEPLKRISEFIESIRTLKEIKNINENL